MTIRLHFAQVVGAWATWLESGNAVLAGGTGESDSAADSLVPVVVDTECAADAKALVSVVLIPADAPGRNRLLWHNIAVKFLFPLHSVNIDRVEAAVWFQGGQRW